MKIVNNAETASLSGCHIKVRVQRNLNKVRQLQLTSVIYLEMASHGKMFLNYSFTFIGILSIIT